MLSKRRNIPRDIRVFQALGGFQKSRRAVTLIVLFAWIIAMPVAPVRAGDILRGGASAANGRRASDARANAGAAAADTAKVRAQDRLARTTKVISDMRALQDSARAAAVASSVPNGLADGGLKVLTGPNAKWQGANAPVVNGNTVNIRQNQSQALLHWETFNVGKDTTLNFDQSAGGVDAGKWIAFNKVFDPAAKPSEIQGKINAQGQVYIINQNGIIFGAGSQVNARALVASTLPINDNLVKNGLLNNKDSQFLFSKSFAEDPSAIFGDVVVERGALLTSPEGEGGNGGRVMLVAPNVTNAGTISTPAGQTILAAGLDVGINAHGTAASQYKTSTKPSTPGEDPSLRGLDVWVGEVGDAGSVTNTGLVEASTGSIVAVGKKIHQSGVLESTTTVNLNGRIDLLATYDAVSNPTSDATVPKFLFKSTGTIDFSPSSLTRIVPAYDSDKSVPGMTLSQKSQINIDANEIHFQQGSALFAPSGNIRIRAGDWWFVESGSFKSSEFVHTGGSVALDPGSSIDVSGTPDVYVPLEQNIIDIQLRGSELADSPLQRDQGLRGKTLTVDLRKSGVYGQRYWIGTPLGDATGFANIIERNVSQLTASGGTVEIGAGGSVSLASGSELNVSGGYFRNQGGLINTTNLLQDGRVVDISKATPDHVYDGVFSDLIESIPSLKWRGTVQYKTPLAPGQATREPDYIEGAAGGAVTFTAPKLTLAGKILGQTVNGPRQLDAPPLMSSISLSTQKDKIVDFSGTQTKVSSYVLPVPVVFSKAGLGGGQGLSLPGVVMDSPLVLPLELVDEEEGGFGRLTVDNQDGSILLPSNTPMVLPAGGRVSLAAANVNILSPITAPGGGVSIVAYNTPSSQFKNPEFKFQLTTNPFPVAEGLGIVTIAPGSDINVAGTTLNDRYFAATFDNSPRFRNGGSIAIEGYDLKINSSTTFDASGGLTISSRGKASFGKGGSISLISSIAGKYREGDISQPARAQALEGGAITLPGKLKAFSLETGGSLEIQAPIVSIGNGLNAQGKSLGLDPSFFQKGGFTSYAIKALGFSDSDKPSVHILDGTQILPRAESLAFKPFDSARHGDLSFETKLLPEGVRKPASLTLDADFQIDNPTTDDRVDLIGSIVMGAGSAIKTDAGTSASVTLKAKTVVISGTIEVPGGKITLQGANKFPAPEISSTDALPTVFIDSTARLLANGAVVHTPDRYGRNTGFVLGGGSISIKGNILAEAGSLMDVSGASAVLDFHPSRLSTSALPSASAGLSSVPWAQQSVAVQVDSSGGTIKLTGGQMLLVDSSLKGLPGGPTAIGGSLSVSSGSFGALDGASINLIVKPSGNVIASTNAAPGIGKVVLDEDGKNFSGMGYFAVDQFSKGGFYGLDLGYDDITEASPRAGNVKFLGDVSIQSLGSIRVAGGGKAPVSGGGVIEIDGKVSLKAPYVAIGQLLGLFPFKDILSSTPINVAPVAGAGSLSVEASLVDAGTMVLKGAETLNISAKNGDIRGSGTLSVAGKINLTAAQVYPASLANFRIFAYDTADGADDGVVTITQSGSQSLPLSAGGSLSVYAPTITQAGTLRAPFGSITLGWDGSDLNPATEDWDAPVNLLDSQKTIPVSKRVTLATTSTTSVSAIDPVTGMGIVVPFGTSLDGNSWTNPVGENITTAGMPSKSVRISATNINQEAGSTIDIRGGGDLLARRWIPGPGGSVDLMGSPAFVGGAAETWSGGADQYKAGQQVVDGGVVYSARGNLNRENFPENTMPETGNNAYWIKVPPAYALVPGFAANFAPLNLFGSGQSLLGEASQSSSPMKVGDQIVLDGSAGIPAGTYTLLPRSYAQFPGACLVTPSQISRGGYDTLDGISIIAGYRKNSFSQSTQEPLLRQNFEILKPSALADRAAYEVYSANTFVPVAAAKLGVKFTQSSPADSGYLALASDKGMVLSGSVLSASTAGRGASIDISSKSAITIASTVPRDGEIILDAARLQSWGASSLLVGGLRRSSADGTMVDVKTESLKLDGISLSGSDVILASSKELIIGEGSSLLATGKSTGASEKILVDGPGALVRVSVDGSADFARVGTIEANDASLVLEDNVQISAHSVVLDSTQSSNYSPSAHIVASNLTLGSGRMLVDFAKIGSDNGVLALGGDLLDGVNQSSALHLNSYTSIDFSGSGTLGSPNLSSLVLKSGGFKSGGENVTIKAGKIVISNPLDAESPTADSLSGELNLATSVMELGDGAFSLVGFEKNNINAARGIQLIGSGSLGADSSLQLNTSALAANRLTQYAISATGVLNLAPLEGTSSVASQLGASLALSGDTIDISLPVILPSGQIKVQAQTGINISSKLNVDGSSVAIYDATRYADAGTISLKTTAGDVHLQSGAVLSVKSDSHGGNAGLLEISAPDGSFSNEGKVYGSAPDGWASGSFHLDMAGLPDYESLNTVLETGGFNQERVIRVRRGDASINQDSKAKKFELYADTGSITISSKIDASGVTGGNIQLSAGGSLTLESTAELTVSADQFNSAGKGGYVFLSAGAQVDGVINPSASLTLNAGSKIDLAVKEFVDGDYTDPASSAHTGKFEGKLNLRAPRSADNSDIQIAQIESTITGASAVLVEGYKLYDLTDDSSLAAIDLSKVNVDMPITLDGIDYTISRLLEPGRLNTLLRDVTNKDSTDFTDSLAAKHSEWADKYVLTPGVEIINRGGDLTLGLENTSANPAELLTLTNNSDPDNPFDLTLTTPEATRDADWDLSEMRYGSKGAPGVLTLRAKGDIVFNNALSDGFSTIKPNADNPLVYDNHFSADENGLSGLWLAPLQTINANIPIPVQSWSYSITAGADTSSSNLKALLAAAGLDEGKGNVLVGELHGSILNTNEDTGDLANNGASDSGTTANNMRLNALDPGQSGTRFEVVRTGTGDISVNAARDVKLRNTFASVYTAGVAVTDATSVFSDGDFVLPVVTFDPALVVHPVQSLLGSPSQNHAPQWSMAGGNIQVLAGNDIKRVTMYKGEEVNDSSRQIPSNWLYRRSHVDPLTGKFGAIAYGDDVTDASASTSWWIDHSNFFQSFGALGGGNVELNAGRDIVNADAMAPTNARMAGVDPDGNNIAPFKDQLLEFGGGDVILNAGRNIDGGSYYVERGSARLFATGEVTTNSARSASLGTLADAEPATESALSWIPATLYLGKGDIKISAQKDVTLSSPLNPFLLPSGLGNKFWYKTYFSTFAPDSSVDVTSLGGSIHFRNSVIYSGEEGPRSSAHAWIYSQNDFVSGGRSSAAYYQPWTRLSETSIAAFSGVLNLAPPILRASSLAGDINIAGDMVLNPSAVGDLELVAKGSLSGLNPIGVNAEGVNQWITSRINISGANPALIPDPVSPLSYFAVLAEGGSLYESKGGFMWSLDSGLSSSGSFTGADASVELKRLRYGTNLLHGDDATPVRVYTKEGGISGLALFTPKFAQVYAGADMTDVSLYLENNKATDISIVSSGGDMILNNPNSPARTAAKNLEAGNELYLANSDVLIESTALAGDIQINGPGFLEVLAGRNLDLGNSPSNIDGTGAGIKSIGNNRNPNLPFESAAIVALAGVGGVKGGAAPGLSGSALAFGALPAGLADIKPAAPLIATPEQQAIANLETLFAIIKKTGKDFTLGDDYEPALSTVKAVLSPLSASGEIFTRERDIRTVSGGGITLAAPRGGLTMASVISSNPSTPPGIVTEYGGSVSILTDGSVDIGRCRIFTLRGGDMAIWSTSGDVAAGTSPKTIVTAPPTRVAVDTPSADIKTDLGGLVTGGGIGVLASVAGVAPGDVYLLAPKGKVDAGDAGIQSTGNLNIAAVAVVNGDNIAAAGSTAGVPSSAPPPSAPVGAAPAASSSSAATSSAAQNMATQGQEKKESDEAPSLISVEVLGYGGGEGDKKDEEEGEKRDEDKSAML